MDSTSNRSNDAHDPVACAKIAERQQRLADLLNCAPEKIEHEVRNLLNELRLLRTLFETHEEKK